MNTKAETQASAGDIAKIAVAVGLVLAAVVAYYQFADISRLIRVLGVIGAVIAAGFVFLQTEQGRSLSAFVKEAQVEVRKVVWPTRQETIQTTGMIIVVVIIVALFLWFLDWVLGGMVRYVIG